MYSVQRKERVSSRPFEPPDFNKIQVSLHALTNAATVTNVFFVVQRRVRSVHIEVRE